MKLIVRVDDLGLSEGVNCGIKQVAEQGIVTSIGLMTNLVDALAGYRMIENYHVSIGLHGNISVGKPILSAEAVPKLIGENGNFHSSRKINEEEVVIDYDQCKKEIKSQLQRFELITGRKPAYVDGHAVKTPLFCKVLRDVCDENDLFYANFGLDDDLELAYDVKSCGAMKLRNQNDYSLKEYFENDEGRIKNKKTVVAIFHPGFVDGQLLECSTLTTMRAAECDFLCSDWFEKWVNTNTEALLPVDFIQ